jgi:PEP-CTERM motif
MKLNSFVVSLAVVTGALGLGSPAFAASTWNLTSNCSGGTGLGNTLNCTGGASSLSVNAWSDNTSTSKYTAAEVRGGSQGLGVRNSSESSSVSSSYTIDNATPGKDMLLLSFGSAVSLNQLSLGFVSGDSDLSVLAYTGSGNGATSVSGKSASNLVSGGGWSLVSQLSGDGSAGSRSFNSAGTYTSSWWLVSAYNSSFGGSSLSGTDYVKLLSVAGNLVTPPPTGKTPEPASLALVGLGMLGVWGARRRARKAVA